MEKMIINRACLAEKISKDYDHLILIDKPADWTSFDVVKKVRHIGPFQKVGHAGTLDPFATGLLILGTGRYTKLLGDISSSEKAYIATFVFGFVSDTHDVDGNMTIQEKIAELDITRIRQAAEQLKRIEQQIPPMYSAKKIGGQRLYKMARKGIQVDREAQPIRIFDFNLLSHDKTHVDFYVRCSKGTYIRALARDLGQLTGYGAYLKSLRRTLIDGYHVNDAITIEEFQNYWRSLN